MRASWTAISRLALDGVQAGGRAHVLLFLDLAYDEAKAKLATAESKVSSYESQMSQYGASASTMSAETQP